MGAHLVILLAAVAVQSPEPDTAVFTSPAVRHAGVSVLADSTRRADPTIRADSTARADSTVPDSQAQRSGIAYERRADIMQYNRVQGLSLGLGYRVRVPVLRSTALYGTVRYGLSDDRVTGRLTLVHDAPGYPRNGRWRLALRGYRDIADVDPFAPGSTVGNSLNALFAAHDNGDYALSSGGGVSFETVVGSGLDLVIGARVERQQSVARKATSEVNDFLGGAGLFPPNPPIDEGTYGGVSVRLAGFGAARWSATLDALGGEGTSTGRLYGELQRGFGGRRGATLRVKAGVATEPTLPQALFRLGGVHTVRGFDYGLLRGSAVWAAQLDLAPISGRVRPILFLDAGQAARTPDLFSSKALVGGGVGVSLLKGWLRFDFSHPISPDIGGKVRFDLIVRGVR